MTESYKRLIAKENEEKKRPKLCRICKSVCPSHRYVYCSSKCGNWNIVYKPNA